jgi:hypothetical protein
MNDNKEFCEKSTDLDNLIPSKNEIRTISGECVSLPTMTLGMELKVMRTFLDFLKDGGYKDLKADNKGFHEVLINAFCNDNGNCHILEMLSIIIGKPAEWILENLDMTSIAASMLPFFVTRIQALTKALESLMMTPSGMPN